MLERMRIDEHVNISSLSNNRLTAFKNTFVSRTTGSYQLAVLVVKFLKSHSIQKPEIKNCLCMLNIYLQVFRRFC